MAVNRELLFQQYVVCFVRMAYFEICMCTVVFCVINIAHT